MTITLNEGQEYAVEQMLHFIHGQKGGGFLLLRGSAGTGKTTTIRAVAERAQVRLIFTAPTNKATRVLRETLTTPDYLPECRTIYSLLGLQLSPEGELKVIVCPDDPVDLTRYAAVIVDEGSMVNTVLWGYIQDVASSQGVKFIVLGDPAQLPPVKERASPVWDIPLQMELSKVVRHDNAVLGLATRIRAQVDAFCPQIRFSSDFERLVDGREQGVWVTGKGFEQVVGEAAANGAFSDGKRAKVIAWRNVTVDYYNALIRKRIFPETWREAWLVEDRIVVTAPVRDLTVPSGKVIATTDDEGVIQRVTIVPHPLHPEFLCWRLYTLLDTNEAVPLYVCHPQSQTAYLAYLDHLKAAAKREGKRWKDYWAFRESFHSLRYAYAITAHRSQGSTYNEVFVVWQDILQNRQRNEGFRCLYVACSRAREKVFLS